MTTHGNADSVKPVPDPWLGDDLRQAAARAFADHAADYVQQPRTPWDEIDETSKHAYLADADAVLAVVGPLIYEAGQESVVDAAYRVCYEAGKQDERKRIEAAVRAAMLDIGMSVSEYERLSNLLAVVRGV